MFIQNPFGNKPPSMVVDKVLGESYKVVKAVYCMLPALKDIASSKNLQIIVDNIEAIKQVLNIAVDIQKISENLDEILKASSYANSAKNSADLSKDWAIKMDGKVQNEDYSSKWYAQSSKEDADYIKSQKVIIEELVQIITEIEEPVKDVANYLEEIKVVNNNITSIKVIANDLTLGSVSAPPKDLGMIGDPAPDTEILGGVVKSVADNIDLIKELLKNLDLFKKCLSLVSFYKKAIQDIEIGLAEIKKVLPEAQKTLKDVQKSLEEAKGEIPKIIAEGTRQLGLINICGEDWIIKINDAAYRAIKQIEEAIKVQIINIEAAIRRAEDAAYQAKLAKEACQAILEEIKNIKKYLDSLAQEVQENTDFVQYKAIEVANNAVQAEVSAQNAKASANLAQSAEANSQVLKTEIDKLNQQVQKSALDVKHSKEKVEGYVNLVTPHFSAIETNANSIQHIITNSQNIKDINVVGKDLELTELMLPFIDYGILNQKKSAITNVTGGNIFICAQNIDKINKVADYIENGGGSGGAFEQINADWNETNPASKAFIKNKPNVLIKGASNDYGDIK